MSKHPPRYPLYIISKGRSDSMLTSRSLARMKVKHFIAIEPQDVPLYEKALDNFCLREYATLCELPFSNHGNGSGPARNWCWEDSIDRGYEKHWVIDDNITDFYRLHKNLRVRVESGVIFRMAEDFHDRFENVQLSGFNYRFFIAADQKYPPYVANTKIYSCILINNACKHRWRGKYNEDVDLCLRVLKDGDCTIQFNAFLSGKAATQTVSGGNTEEVYNADKMDYTETTKEKSQMLVDSHPDVARMVMKYGRWHHYVDYRPFKKNKLRYKKDFVKPTGINNYGLKLVTDWRDDEHKSRTDNSEELVN